MSEVEDINNKNNNQNKNPLDTAVNKLREAATKELQKKIDDKAKAAYDADKIRSTLVAELKLLLKEQEVQKVELNDFLKGLK